MSFSRWGCSRWYSFWACQEDGKENRDTALFEICDCRTFTAKELRADIEACLTEAARAEVMSVVISVSDADREELRGYMLEFLAAVDRKYPDMKGGE